MFTSTKLIPVMLLSTSFILFNTPSVFACSEPLLLTPYIQKEDIATARDLSLVNDEEGIIPRSYAGFITVDQSLNNHLFFWYFPTFNPSTAAPLLIWLNGGPGESSMAGLLLQNGPIQFGTGFTGKTIYKIRNNTWVNKFSMLYIDNPVGVGYSYSERGQNGSRTTQEGYTRDLYEFIKQFYQLFPELLQRDLYIGGESYAGKYVPAFAYIIHQSIQSGESNIPLKGIYLGAPIMDAKVQMFIIFDVYYALGYITIEELNEFKKNLTEKLPQSESQQFVYEVVPLLYPNTYANVYTFEATTYDNEITAVMKSEYLRTLLHVGNLSFEVYNLNIYTSVIRDDLFVSSLIKLPELMDNYKVLIYSGDMDGIISSMEIEAVLHSVQWSLQGAYNSSRRQVWRDENGQIKGFYTRVYTFCRVVIRRAGHHAAYDQPDNVLELMDNYVTNGCLS